MRIACITGVSWPVPPHKYGGTERIMAQLCRGFKAAGHNVTLYAAGDSTVIQDIRSTSPHHLGSTTTQLEYHAANRKLFSLLTLEQDQFDIIINFMDENVADSVSTLRTPSFTVLHMPLFQPAIDTFRRHNNIRLISISQAQREPAPDLNFIATIHNAIDVATVPYTPKLSRNELFYLGTIHPWKGTHLLQNVAKELRCTITLAGQIGDQQYFNSEIAPYIGTYFDYVGELTDEEKYARFANVRALLHPVLVRDSCPLTLMEAAACGIPAIGFDNGAVREIIEQGVTGFVVSNINEMINILKQQKDREISSQSCRQRATIQFSSQRMVYDYLRICRLVLQNESSEIRMPTSVSA